MITRIVIIMLIAVLALPVATLTRPGETNPLPWGDVAVDAKGKKHKKSRKPKFTTVRQEVTRTFTNTNPISMLNDSELSNPYPAVITVDGFTNGEITDVNLTVHRFSHTAPADVDILLAASQLPGQNAIVMSDFGNDPDLTDITVTLDDQAAAPLPVEGPIDSGTFQPTNIDGGSGDDFPGQTPSGSSALSLFNGGEPNGEWAIYVIDDHISRDPGQIEGWSLQITAEADVKVKQKKGKKGKK